MRLWQDFKDRLTQLLQEPLLGPDGVRRDGWSHDRDLDLPPDEAALFDAMLGMPPI